MKKSDFRKFSISFFSFFIQFSMKNFRFFRKFSISKIFTDRSSKWPNFLPDEALIDFFFFNHSRFSRRRRWARFPSDYNTLKPNFSPLSRLHENFSSSVTPLRMQVSEYSELTIYDWLDLFWQCQMDQSYARWEKSKWGGKRVCDRWGVV